MGKFFGTFNWTKIARHVPHGPLEAISIERRGQDSSITMGAGWLTAFYTDPTTIDPSKRSPASLNPLMKIWAKSKLDVNGQSWSNCKVIQYVKQIIKYLERMPHQPGCHQQVFMRIIPLSSSNWDLGDGFWGGRKTRAWEPGENGNPRHWPSLNVRWSNKYTLIL